MPIRALEQRERRIAERQHDEASRFSGFRVIRRANTVLILNDQDPAKDRAIDLESATSAHRAFVQAVHQPYLIEVPYEEATT